jgi:hypothetical protein
MAPRVANGLVADDGERQCVVQLRRHPLVFSHIVAAGRSPLADRTGAPGGGVTLKVNRGR